MTASPADLGGLSGLSSPDSPAVRPIRLRPAPRREPPFDDELRGPEGHREVIADGRLRLAASIDQQLPFDESPTVSPRRSHRRIWSAPVATARAELPDPALAARRLLVGLLEARAGLRPLRQLSGHLSPAVHAGLMTELARVPGAAGAGRQAVLRSVHVCEPADGVAEVAAVVSVGTRHRAIAARLEGLDGRWRCVRLQLG